MVIGLVPTYRPMAAAVEAVELLARSVDVVVVDDGSPCTSDPVLAAIADLPRVELLRCRGNRGIAAALDIGFARAAQLGADRVVTIDQDTSLPPAAVDRLLAAWSRASGAGEPVGAVGCGRVGRLTVDVDPATGQVRHPELVQAGTVWSLAAVAAVGGIDRTLVIDAVDADLCLRLVLGGFTLHADPGLAIEHEVGDAREVGLLGATALMTGHRPFRRYYITRNRLRSLPRLAGVDAAAAVVAARRLAVGSLLAVTREDDRARKAAAVALGVADAARGRSGALSPSRRDRLS